MSAFWRGFLWGVPRGLLVGIAIGAALILVAGR